MSIKPIDRGTPGNAWWVMPQGVRRVIIARWNGQYAMCHWSDTHYLADPDGVRRAPSLNDLAVANTDLFAVEQDARLESQRRRAAVRDAADRRFRRAAEPFGRATSVTAGLILGLILCYGVL